MAIEINEGWYINNAGTGETWTTSLLQKNTSNLPENKQNKHCWGVPDVMWQANWNWSSGSSSATQTACRFICDRANNIYDHSFCWSGLGYESFVSRMQYVCYGNMITGKGDKPLIYHDSNTNTPWSFDYDEGWNRNNQSVLGRTWNYSNWQNNKNQYGYQYTWKNNTDTTTPNNNSQYWDNYFFCDRGPIQAIAPNNWINLICVIAKKSLNVSVGNYSSNVGAWDLYTYAKTNIHETYPYIIGVFIVPFAENNASNGKREMFYTGGTNRYVKLSLSTYNEPAINGKLLFTSGDDTQNIALTSMWHNSVISRPNWLGSFENWTGVFTGTFRFNGNDNVVHSTYCAVPIMGAIFTGTQSSDLMQNGVFAYKEEQSLQLRLGDSKWQEEYGHYTVKYGYEYDGVCYYREFDNDFHEDCMKQAACFGLLFTDRYSVAYEGNVDDRYMFLGVLDEHNIGHGEYTRGYDNLDQPQLNWTNTTNADYTPSYNPPIPSVDPNTYGTPWNYNSPDMCNTGQQYYSLTGANVEKIVGDLWAALDTKPSDISVTDFCKEKYLSNNPLDVVVSLKRFPFELPTGTQQNPENIVLGTFETSAEGYVLPLSYKWVYLGNCSLYEHFGGNFLDYVMTTAQLYIPFCGTIEIDVPFFMGDSLEIYMAVDYYTGACTAYVQRVSDKMVYATVNGNCSIDLPITGIQSATLNSTLINAKQSVIGGAVGAIGKTIAGMAAIGAATVATGGAALVGGLIGGAAGVAGGGIGAAQADAKNYELHHTQIPLKQIGANSGQNSWCGELRPILYLYRPIIAENYNAADYGHTIGFATCVSDTIGNYSGYIEATNIDLSGFAATDEEKTAINNLLVRGVYL